jgi:hypothetical protein
LEGEKLLEHLQGPDILTSQFYWSNQRATPAAVQAIAEVNRTLGDFSQLAIPAQREAIRLFLITGEVNPRNGDFDVEKLSLIRIAMGKKLTELQYRMDGAIVTSSRPPGIAFYKSDDVIYPVAFIQPTADEVKKQLAMVDKGCYDMRSWPSLLERNLSQDFWDREDRK